MTPKGMSVTNVSGITRYSSVDLVSYTAFGFLSNFHCDLKVSWTSPHIGTETSSEEQPECKKNTNQGSYSPVLEDSAAGGSNHPERVRCLHSTQEVVWYTQPLATACSPSYCLASCSTYTRLQEEYSVASFLGLWDSFTYPLHSTINVFMIHLG